jgi:apolipoprotein N-acyltransferase
MFRKILNRLPPTLWVFIAGALLPLAFAPLHWVWLAVISPALLLHFWLKTHSPRHAAWLGFWFGMGCFGVGTSWIYISIHTYGNANIVVASLITLIFVAVLSLLFPTTQGYAFKRITRNTSRFTTCVLLFSSCWVFWEIVRTVLFTGFPWLFLGYSTLGTSLQSYAPLFGVYGISFILTLTAGVLIYCLQRPKSWHQPVSLLLPITLWIIGSLLHNVAWTQPGEQSLKVTLVQGNINQFIKWQSTNLSDILAVYNKETSLHWDSNLIVWPEAAIPTTQDIAQDYLNSLDAEAKQHRAALIVGLPTVDLLRKQYHNSLLGLGMA